MIKYVISQIFALIAVILLAITFLIKERKKILVINMFTALAYACQYILLGAYSGLACNLVTMVAYIWYYIDERKNIKNNTISLVVISLLYIIVGIFTFSSWVDILIIFASILFTLGVWQKSILVYRWIGVLMNVFWFVYNFVFSAWVSLIMESALGIVKVVGLVLYYIEMKKSKNQTDLNE